MILSNVLSVTNRFLGATYIYNDDKKTFAANAARKHLLSNYEIGEFIRTASVSFTSGVASKPSNYLRGLKLFNPTTTTLKYDRIDENQFDNNQSYTWTIKWDGTSAYKMYIYPADTTTLTMRFIYLPTDMSAQSDDSGFNSYWDEALGAMAAYYTLLFDRQTAAATSMLTWATELTEMALRQQSIESGQSNNLQTIYDTDLLLGSEES